jgi:hypothetical protein
MAIEKEVTYDHTIKEDGQIEVCRITRLVEDGVVLAKNYHRHVVEPGTDVTDQDERTKLISGVVHTAKNKKDFKDKKEKEKKKNFWTSNNSNDNG